MGRAWCVALGVAVLAGCAAKQPMMLGERVPKGCNKESDNSEFCMGWALDRFLLMLGFREYDDPQVSAYIQRIGRRLARAAGTRQHWTFRIVDDPEVQAYALMGGTIYLNRGTLAALRSEAELAAVLGHEMGHVLGGHAREHFADSDRDVVRSQLAQSKQIRWARDDEIQADELAVILTARAGYDPNAVVAMLRALGGTYRYDADEDPDSVHPWWPERIARAEALASAYGRGELGVERYRAGVASLVVDEDPRIAAVARDAVVFAHAGIAIDLPARKSVQRSDATVRVVLADGAELDIQLCSVFLAELIQAMRASSGDTATAIRVAGREAIVVTVTGADARRRAQALALAIRTPRRDELAALVPTRVDLNVPRKLWAR